MSRTLARWLNGVVHLVTELQSESRRAMTLSRLIDHLQRDAAVWIDTRHGPLMLLPLRGPRLAAAVLNFGRDEPEMLDWIDSFGAGETFWDIGAAAGLFSLYAALIPNVTVYAFEPKATSYGALTEHLALNGLGDRVTPLAIAFSDRIGLTRLEMWTLAPGSGNSALDGAPDQFGNRGYMFSQGAMAWSIDGFRRVFALRAPDHIKIDVNGIAGAILRGAGETLCDVTSVMIEVGGEYVAQAESRIEPALLAAGLSEVIEVRGSGSGRNRLYRRV
jgi:FkbM family methyltransferase